MDDWLGIIFKELNHIIRTLIILNYFYFLAFAKIRFKSINYFRTTWQTVSPARIYSTILVHAIGLKKPSNAFCVDITLLQSLAARTYYQRKVNCIEEFTIVYPVRHLGVISVFSNN